MRTAIKRAVMRGYCVGAVPAWMVKGMFQLFRLQGA